MTTSIQYDFSIEKLMDIVKKGMLSRDEARFLVNTYYMIQNQRKRTDNQISALEKLGKPTDVLSWFNAVNRNTEDHIKKALDIFSNNDPKGKWARSIVGIGPVIAAGLIAYIDMEKAQTAGAIWRYAGLDPTVKWEKGEKRPWNATLKVLCWKIGESFVKQCNRNNCFYGEIYKERKEYECLKNENLDYKEQAFLKEKVIGKSTEAYKYYSIGKLPPAHIQSRVKRYAVKLFLAHYHEIAYKLTFGKEPPLPYPIAILGHTHKIEPPNKPV